MNQSGNMENRLQPSIEKEIFYAEKFYENLCHCRLWRYAAISNNARRCRESLDKAFALNGHTGLWLFDLLVYMVNLLPIFVPITFFLVPALIATIFLSLKAMITTGLHYMWELLPTNPQIIEVPATNWLSAVKSVFHNALDHHILSTSTQQTIQVPIIPFPDHHVIIAMIILIVLFGTFILSCIFKWMFKIELKYRMKLLKKAIVKQNRL